MAGVKGEMINNQGDLSYSGILTQLIKNNIDVSKIKKSLFKIDYSDFFNMKDNFEFTYDNDSVKFCMKK